MEISNENAVAVGAATPQVSPGHAGIQSQVPGQPVTVSGVAAATGGVGPGQLVEVDIDKELFQFESDDTPAMQLMLFAKSVQVNSPVIQHYSIDQPRATAVTTAAVEGGNGQAVLPVANADKALFPAYTTVLVKGVDGYTEDGKAKTPGKDLMLFVAGRDATTDRPIVRAVNGPRTNSTDETCNVPAIPAGTTLVLLSNALYETQEIVAPDLVVPQPQMLYAQKRGMTSIVSDYFRSQAKRIPFQDALIAEAQIRNFKIKGNRTLWAGRKGKMVVNTELGPQTIYMSEGIRYSIRRHLDHTGKWSFEELVALSKMVFTGEDVPKKVVILAGKNFIENIQCIDFSKHPEVKIDVTTNDLGWKVSTIHTVFGAFEIKHEPTLDRLGWSNSGAVIAYDRLVHYIYSQEHKNTQKVDGHEATRETLVVWDALGLKGSAHIWIDGEGEKVSDNATGFVMWDSEEAPDSNTGKTIVLLRDCPAIGDSAVSGTMWTYKDGAWVETAGQLATAE